jgi:7,8-dihydroneopterin aldolase/epimerase/oxygenase
VIGVVVNFSHSRHFKLLIDMGLIQIENMEFYSFHGHFKEEQIVGNKFIVDLSIETDMKIPSETDNLKDAVDYQKAYQIVKVQMEKKSHLLENIAGRIIDAIYAEMSGIMKLTVKVSKMNPPMGGKIGSVSVTMSR